MSNWRNTSDYRKWVASCKDRDGHKCVITGAKTKLQVHHLNHGSYFPDERFDVNNGVTIHRLVHLIFHILLMGGYRKKCTKADWKRFVRLFKYIRLISKLMHSTMKSLILFIALSVSMFSFSQKKKVDIFDKNRKIIKLQVKEKDIEKTLKNHKGDTIYIQKKVNGKWRECKYIRRKNGNKEFYI